MIKIYSSLFFFFLAITFSSSAQIKPTIKAGVTQATWKGDAQTNRNGFYVGAGVDIPLGDFISVEPSLQYTQRGYGLKGNLNINQLKIDALNARATSQMHYVDLPLMLKVKPVKGLQVFAGPQVSYLVKNNLRADVAILGFSLLKKDLDITDQFNRWDVGVAGGIGYEFENGIGFAATYERGFNRLDKNQQFKVFNEGYKVGLTYKFQ
jgi:hypothetical protein